MCTHTLSVIEDLQGPRNVMGLRLYSFPAGTRIVVCLEVDEQAFIHALINACIKKQP